MTKDEDKDFWALKPGLKGKIQDVHVSHGQDGFIMHVDAVSRFRSAVEDLSDKFCVLTGHRVCNTVHMAAVNWADKSRTPIYSQPVTREVADQLSWHTNTWAWLLDDDEDEEPKEA